MKIFILLDVDGVMIAYPEGPGPQPNFFSKEPVTALHMILDCDPRVEIVLSSSMRVYAREKFDKLFVSAGFDLNRVVGETRWEGSMRPNREREIKHFIRYRGEHSIVLPIDDEVIEGVLYMKTNSLTGLTIKDAEDCIRHIKAETQNGATLCQPDHFGLGMSYIPKRDEEL